MIASLPTPKAIAGQILFLMMDGIERTRWDINRALGFSVEKETTARVRDLRKCGFDVPCVTRNHGGQVLHCYRLLLSTDEELTLKTYHYVTTHLGSTAYEIAKALDADVEAIHAKLCLLENLSRIARAEERVCNVMGREEATWWIA